MPEARTRLTEAIEGERRDWHRVEVRPDDIAAILAAPSPALTREALALAVHKTRADNDAPEYDMAEAQRRADAILRALGTPPPAIRCASCKTELRYDPTDPVAHIGCLIREESETPAPTSTREERS